MYLQMRKVTHQRPAVRKTLTVATRADAPPPVRIEAPPRLIARMPTHDLWMTAFRDTEGNVLELMSEAPRVG